MLQTQRAADITRELKIPHFTEGILIKHNRVDCMCTSTPVLRFPHQFGTRRGRQVSQRGWTVCLCGRGLTGSCLVLDGLLREDAVRKWLPADLPQLHTGRHILLVQHRAGVMPDLVTVVHPQPWRTRGCDNVLTIRTPREMCGVWFLRSGHLRGQRGLENCCPDTWEV